MPVGCFCCEIKTLAGRSKCLRRVIMPPVAAVTDPQSVCAAAGDGVRVPEFAYCDNRVSAIASIRLTGCVSVTSCAASYGARDPNKRCRTWYRRRGIPAPGDGKSPVAVLCPCLVQTACARFRTPDSDASGLRCDRWIPRVKVPLTFDNGCNS